MSPERLFAILVVVLWVWMTIYIWRRDYFSGWVDKVLGAILLGAIYTVGAIMTFGFLAVMVGVAIGAR